MGDSGTAREVDGRLGCWVGGGCAVGFFIVLGLLVVVLSLGGGCGPGAGVGFDPRSDQAAFQAKVVNDRKQLFAGTLDFHPSVAAVVDDSMTYKITLRALGEDASRRSAPVPRGMETRRFQVGGVEGATLSSTSRSVQVELLADSRTKQVIAEPGDTAHWQWRVSPSEPGDYDLLLVLTTYQGESDRALDTLTPPIVIHLSVSNTLSHSISSMQAFLITSGGVAAALTAILAFRAPLLDFMRARGNSTRQQRGGDEDEREGYM